MMEGWGFQWEHFFLGLTPLLLGVLTFFYRKSNKKTKEVVSDNKKEIVELLRRVVVLENKIREKDKTIEELTLKVEWLTKHLSPKQAKQYKEFLEDHHLKC